MTFCSVDIFLKEKISEPWLFLPAPKDLLHLYPFPNLAKRQHPDGLVAVSSSLLPEMILAAVQQGCFPWTENPVGWFSPKKRAVFFADSIHLPRNLKKLARKANLTVSVNEVFAEVMVACQQSHAKKAEGQTSWEGTWIGPNFLKAYTMLHRQGYAHSVEIWQEERLVGGIYGIGMSKFFGAESMFHLVDNASKIALMVLWQLLLHNGLQWMDAQVLNDHTSFLGAKEISAQQYHLLLQRSLI